MRTFFTLFSILWFTGVIAQPAVNIYSEQYPVARSKKQQPAVCFGVAPQAGKTNTLNEVVITLDPTVNLNDIESVKLFCTSKTRVFNADEQFGEAMQPARRMVFKGDFQFTEKSFVWVSFDVKEDIDLLNKITVNCPKIVVDNNEVLCALPGQEIRMGVAVREAGDDGSHTYRIPGITTSNDGSLLAIYDIRRDKGGDLQGNIDIGLSRSTDGGKSWEPMRVALDMGEWGGLPEKFNGVSDANILVDKNTNDIYVIGLWMHGVKDENGTWIEGLTQDSTIWNHQWRNKATQPGFGVKQTCQTIISKSSDDGKSWSAPENITPMVKQEEWWLAAPAPGHGITLKDGTLVYPSQGRNATGGSFSNITYSKDGGKTWTPSNAAFFGSTECMAAELSDGGIMLNMRFSRNRGNAEKNGRIVAVTYDLGQTWSEHPTSHNALIEPTCMASLHRHDYTENGEQKSILLFANPNSVSDRRFITLKVSFDDGLTWPEEKWILLDSGKGRGYSCITSVDEQNIGILYESSKAHMMFQKISLQEILNK